MKNQSDRKDITFCPVCNVPVKKDRLDTHVATVHQKSRSRPSDEHLLAAYYNAKYNSPEYAQAQKEFAYRASVAFTLEILNHANTQRHNHDDISLDVQSGRRGLSWQRLNIERETTKREKAEQERRREERIALVATKQAQGLAEVVAGCVVTVYDVEAEETTSYYMASAEQDYYHKQRVFVDRHDEPPGGADECLYADCDLYKILFGSFVDDEVQAQVPAGVLKFRILSVKSCDVAENGLRVEMSVRNNTDAETQPHARIGSETWTFMARDGGQFGSISRHDDYSDQSDAEVNDNDWIDEHEE